ncbi:MAG: Asp-tRNA(Asn)/Glu-tRNA(Gln) amidotransferase subunit GatB [Anaerofustis stercorihominis]|nr:Asp-tRNA(Asn)/Glu-tRNA(Gln) amidotransferase subunit GatB [Anaerofustis stercorihominis]
MVYKEYETVIGLEIHCELATKTKIFCSCPTTFGAKENENVCPVCLGMPGTLPVLNKSVVDFAVRVGIALNCEIANYSKMDRKNYFYPDLPKAYQISQYEQPICQNGYLDIEDEQGNTKRIGITRIHIEEDAGKLIHSYRSTLLDNNRCGVPLIEIVTEPDMRSAFEAEAFARKVRSIIQATKSSDCKMQEGSIRFDVNLSIMPKGSDTFGTRTEMKNLNSFRSLIRAIGYESRRQEDVLNDGGEIYQETRRWDDTKGMSITMRSKEDAHDYRYFPDPDLVPIVLTDEYIQNMKDTLPELPDAKLARYVNDLSLTEYDAKQITLDPEVCEFFEEASKSADAKTCANFIIGDIFALIKNSEEGFSAVKFTAKQLADLINLVADNTISLSASKKVLAEMFETGEEAKVLVDKLGLAQISDTDAIESLVIETIKNNPKSVEDFKAGKTKAVGFIVGQVMKASKGKANPKVVNELVDKALKSI